MGFSAERSNVRKWLGRHCFLLFVQRALCKALRMQDRHGGFEVVKGKKEKVRGSEGRPLFGDGLERLLCAFSVVPFVHCPVHCSVSVSLSWCRSAVLQVLSHCLGIFCWPAYLLMPSLSDGPCGFGRWPDALSCITWAWIGRQEITFQDTAPRKRADLFTGIVRRQCRDMEQCTLTLYFCSARSRTPME